MKNKIKIFDVCGTLYHSNTTVDFCEWMEPNFFKKLFLKASKTIPGRIFSKIIYKSFKYDLIRDIHIKSLNGKNKEYIEAKANEFVSSYLEKKKNIEVHNILMNDLSNVVLVSASLEPIIKAISKKLGIKKYYATSLSSKNDIYNGKIEKDLAGKKHNLFTNEKIELVVTDNLDDYKLCLISEKFIIVSKRKHIKIWENRDLKNMIKVIKV